jgi:hypothetical protein
MNAQDFVSVPAEAVEWLKKHYPALCERSGLCEQVGGRLYTRSAGPQAKRRDRDADRISFPDPEFNAWLDEAVADGGYTTWDLVKDTVTAWQAWSAAIQSDRFFMDHGLWHDRVTGQHMYTQDQYDQSGRSWYVEGARDQRDGILQLWAQAKVNDAKPGEPK